MSQNVEENNKQLQAVNELLRDYSKAQSETIKQLKTALIVVSICFSLIICSMVAGFFWYESQFEVTETTTTTMETEGENANINSVTNGDMYNDTSTHNDYRKGVN